MVWSRVLVAAGAAIALLAGDTRAQACPDGQFSVSVLDNPQVQCLASRPCSGVYGPEGLLVGVGACPSGAGCALLPHNPTVMGCVAAGRADVSYVNPDGSLSKGGVVIAGPPNANSNSNGANGGYTDPNNANKDSANANTNGATANSTSTVETTPTPAANTNVPTPAHVKPGDVTAGSNDDAAASKAPSSSESSTAPTSGSSSAPASSGKPGDATNAAGSSASVTETPTPTPTPTPTSTPSTTPTTSTNQQNALDNIEGDIASNSSRGKDSGGVKLGSIIAIVMGCLAVVAVIAGVFVLRKKKEQALETPAGGALDDYMGAGGVTPKENVLLL